MRVLQITLRCDPVDHTLIDLYRRLEALPSGHKGVKLVTGRHLVSMHANGLLALRAMRNEGCIEFKEITVQEPRQVPLAPKPAHQPGRPTPKRPSESPSRGGF